MAHFYGTVQGSRGPGLQVRHHHAGGAGASTLLYCGLIKDLLNMEKRAAMMHALGVQKFMEGHSDA